jgi:hypothetical protein
VEIAGVGHAPTLMHEDQIGVVREFLLESTPDESGATAQPRE